MVEAWSELANRIAAETVPIALRLEAARSGGNQVAGQARGVETAGNELLSVVSSARPGGETSQLAGANSNAVGVSQDMGRAVGKAHDPNTDPGPLDADAANRAARGGANSITGGASRLGNYPEPPDGGGGDGGPPQI